MCRVLDEGFSNNFPVPLACLVIAVSDYLEVLEFPCILSYASLDGNRGSVPKDGLKEGLVRMALQQASKSG